MRPPMKMMGPTPAYLSAIDTSSPASMIMIAKKPNARGSVPERFSNPLRNPAPQSLQYCCPFSASAPQSGQTYPRNPSSIRSTRQHGSADFCVRQSTARVRSRLSAIVPKRSENPVQLAYALIGPLAHHRSADFAGADIG